MIAQSQASAGRGTESTQGRSEAGITALVAQANCKSRVKDNSKDRAKKSAADEAVEAAGKELHLRHVLWQQGKRRKATPVEIAAAGPVIDVDELDEVVEELDMLESPMRTRKIPQKLLNWWDRRCASILVLAYILRPVYMLVYSSSGVIFVSTTPPTREGGFAMRA